MDDFGKNIKYMSKLTHRILSSIDYERILLQRDKNLKTIHDILNKINEFPLDINIENGLMIYPLLVRKKGLREMLVSRNVYVSRWWKYLMDLVPQDSIEYTLSEWLLPLPIDHRYSKEDIKDMAKVVYECYEVC